MKRFLSFILTTLLVTVATVPATADQQEQQIGQQVYQQLAQKGEILTNSPYYAILAPIARRIKRVTDSQYDAPFRFVLVHEAQPNAFAVPGGNVYVTDSMLSFAKNTEELAGVLCHETSHTIHHDVMNELHRQQTASLLATALSLLIGRGQNEIVNSVLNIGGGQYLLKFSRDVERNADLKGAQTCAQAGYNPWGMVWLFDQFQNQKHSTVPEFLSDHPRDDHRIADLEAFFAANPRLMSRYYPDLSTALPINSNAPSRVRPGYRAGFTSSI